MRVLVACEFSQIVTKAFRDKGHEAYSCDLEPCLINKDWHIQDDVLNHLDDGWDLMIGHPECTYLTITGNKWFYHPDDWYKAEWNRRPHPEYPTRKKDREKAVKFFMDLVNAPINKICIENPVGIMSTEYRKPDQIIQPYEFGDPFEKKTCLWLKNLPKLLSTSIINPPERARFKSGKSMASWYSNSPPKERSKLRAITFPGIAKCMANTWG